MIPDFQCPRLPWMIDFHSSDKGETLDQQYKAAFASTALDHSGGLTYKSKPPPFRSTQLICTLPADPNPSDIEDMLSTGVSLVRVLSGKNDAIKKTLATVRLAVESFSKKIGRVYSLGIALEMAGPVIRTGQLKEKNQRVFLEKGQITQITTDNAYEDFVDKDMIYVDYEGLPEVVQPGDTLLLENGSITLSAIECVRSVIKCVVDKAGMLLSHSSVIVPNTPLNLARISLNDKQFVQMCIGESVDFLFVSGVTSKDTLVDIKSYMEPGGEHIQIISRIENTLNVNEIEEMIKVSDGICIDCEKLMMELPKEKVFLVQKSILAKCNLAGKPVITSLLISSGKELTKPEISDIAGAVIDGSDAFLLPQRSISTNLLQSIDTVCREAEAAVHQKTKFVELKDSLPMPMESVYSLAISAVETAFKSNAAAIICLTASGRTAKVLARYARVAKQLGVFHGVEPLLYLKPFTNDWSKDIDERIQYAVTFGKYSGYIRMGDVIISVTSSRPECGLANTMKVAYASEFDAVPKNLKQKCSPK